MIEYEAPVEEVMRGRDIRPTLLEHPTGLQLSEIVAYFNDQPEVLLAYIFGSAVTGGVTSMSDVDLAVQVRPDPDALSLLQRQLALSRDLAAFSAEREIDVVLLNRASPLLRYEVAERGLLIFERRASDGVSFEARARQRFFDLKPMLDFHSAAVLQRIEEVGLGRGRPGDPRAIETARRLHGQAA
jgi:predicted nucleotidyltransferase